MSSVMLVSNKLSISGVGISTTPLLWFHSTCTDKILLCSLVKQRAFKTWLKKHVFWVCVTGFVKMYIGLWCCLLQSWCLCIKEKRHFTKWLQEYTELGWSDVTCLGCVKCLDWMAGPVTLKFHFPFQIELCCSCIPNSACVEFLSCCPILLHTY